MNVFAHLIKISDICSTADCSEFRQLTKRSFFFLFVVVPPPTVMGRVMYLVNMPLTGGKCIFPGLQLRLVLCSHSGETSFRKKYQDELNSFSEVYTGVNTVESPRRLAY